MDDFNITALYESKNEWCARLVNIFTPPVIEGYKSILKESIKLCRDSGEPEKYLMTFQNLISRVPKWNPEIIENERKRISTTSGCNYLEELITCVHIIQLKTMTAMRVGQKQKKIDINIPKLDDFIHKVYINVARKIYTNVYLFEITKNSQLEMQKNNRNLEIIVQECIMYTIRENVPVEAILRAYLGETTEEDVTEEIKEQIIDLPHPAPVPVSSATDATVAATATAATTATDSLQSLQISLPPPPPPPPPTPTTPSASQPNEDDAAFKILNQSATIDPSEFQNIEEDPFPELLTDIEVLD